MEISLINLDRQPGRLARFCRVNAHLGQVTRIAAVDGGSYSRAKLIEKNILAEPMPGYTTGAIGCALSHLSLWERAFNSAKVTTVAEDDAFFHRDFEFLAPALLESLPPGWDIVLWGWNFDSILLFDMLPGVFSCLGQFDQEQLRASLAAYRTSQVAPRTYRLSRAFGTVCYSISPAGAGRLHGHCMPIRPMETFYPGLKRTLPNEGIDRMMNSAYPNLQAYVCFPPLVVTENDHANSTTVEN
jgi:GR25 family glycosyltransferase involved in LPS biosynthesis